jgi:TRAP-type C4-dicarboxylate transport system permease small subunit
MNRIASFIDVVAGFLLGLVVVLTVLEAGLRYLFAIQVPDAYSLAGHAQGIAIMWGIASATYAGRHITVDLLYDALPSRGRNRINIVAALVSAGFLATVAWMFWRKVERASNSFEVTNDLRLSVWIFLAVAAAGITVAVGMALLRAWQLWRDGVHGVWEKSGS